MVDLEQLKKIKLVVSDLDGTLLNDEGEVSEKNVALIKKVEELGVHFTFASGRLHSAMLDFADKLDIRIPIISLDGALVKDIYGSKIVSETIIPVKKVLKAIHLSEHLLLKIVLGHGDAIYFTEHNSTVPDLIDKFGAQFVEVDSYFPYIKNTLEIVLIGDSKSSIRYAEHRLTFPHTFGLVTSSFKSSSNDGLYYLEIRKKGATKATGMMKLLKHLRIGIKETAVIGDWYNDKSLFETDAFKVALANAVAEIKYSADLITKNNNNESGVAEFLEMIIKAKTK